MQPKYMVGQTVRWQWSGAGRVWESHILSTEVSALWPEPVYRVAFPLDWVRVGAGWDEDSYRVWESEIVEVVA